MAFYRDRILPHLIKLAMRGEQLVPYRERAVSAAKGRVLEIGIGAGENLPRYGVPVSEVIGIELTEGFMMDPEASVSALAFIHPDCTYFSIGEE